MDDVEASPTVRRVVGPTILLRSGEYFDFLAPEASRFTIEDIAHGLSHICRFTGQCRVFYSVAEHCVHVSRIVPDGHALAGLLHDAAEAFAGDVSKPLKDMLPDYRLIEKRIEAAALDRFGVHQPLDPCIKTADIIMLVTEQRQLMQNRDDWDYTRGHQPIDMDLPCWSPEDARAAFLDRFSELACG